MQPLSPKYNASPMLYVGFNVIVAMALVSNAQELTTPSHCGERAHIKTANSSANTNTERPFRSMAALMILIVIITLLIVCATLMTIYVKSTRSVLKKRIKVKATLSQERINQQVEVTECLEPVHENTTRNKDNSLRIQTSQSRAPMAIGNVCAIHVMGYPSTYQTGQSRTTTLPGEDNSTRVAQTHSIGSGDGTVGFTEPIMKPISRIVMKGSVVELDIPWAIA